MFVSSFLLFWLAISGIIVIYDACFVLLRPETLPGGKYADIYSPYQLYIKYDTLYGNMQDSFVVIQSQLNLIEVFMSFVAVFLSLSSCKVKKVAGALLAIITSCFVFWKTVIFVMYDKDFITPGVFNLQLQAILVYIIPSSCWIVFPLMIIWTVSRNLVNAFRKENVQKIKKN